MKKMRKLLFAAAMFGVATSAVGGTNNAFTFYPSDAAPVTALSNPVTYSTPASGKIPAMQTYVGFTVGDPVTGLLLSNSSGNTVNDVTITFTVSVTDSAEVLTFYLPDVYVLPPGCTRDTVPSNVRTVTCKVRQLRSGNSFPAFTVFFVAPQKVCQPTAPDNPCGGAGDALGSDTISTNVTVVYAEGFSGPNPVHPNSNQEKPQPNLVTLGTSNPVNVKSAVPKTGAKVFTGSGGVPVPDTPATPDGQFAELLTVPALLGAYTVAEISVTKVKDTDVTGEGPNCLNGGRFKACPTFATSVANNGVETRFLDPQNPLTFTYRIDASNIKMAPSKLLNSVSIKYTGKKYDPITGAENGTWPDWEVPKVCVNNQASKDGLPCVLSSRCYKRNETGGIADLESDCEWTLINTGNGLLKLQ